MRPALPCPDNATDHQDALTNDQVLTEHIAAAKRAMKKLNFKQTGPLFSSVFAGSLEEEDDVDVAGLSDLARENILVVDLDCGLISFNPRRVQTFFTETYAFWLVCCHPLLTRME
eukprot:INCI13333.1.p2 GENE.INCI13333.1~~INCI13333.1.p2  ORF type:complete len:115 (+),score=19.31 INCI13333.1:20-364(+)